MTKCEYLTDSSFPFFNWWSSKKKLETLCNYSTFLLIDSFDSHCLWVHPKYTWSRKDADSPKWTCLKSTFRIGSIFCFFPAYMMSSTHKEKNNPFSLGTNRYSQKGTFCQSCSNRTFSNCLSHNSPWKRWPYRFRSGGTTVSFIRTMIQVICVVVDECQYLDIPILEFSVFLEYLPIWSGYKQTLNQVLVLHSLINVGIQTWFCNCSQYLC